MSNLWQDIRYGVRTLIKKPGFSSIVVLTLALGIGANSAIFSIVNAYMFRPLPVKDPHELMVLATMDEHIDIAHEVSYPNYVDLRDRSGVFTDAIAYSNDAVHISTTERAERIFIEWVTGNYFSMLGVNAQEGRTFSAEEGRVPDADPVMVLSYGLWQHLFAGDPSAIGKAVKINGHSFTIVGVAPESFPGTDNIISVDAYLPLGAQSIIYPTRRDTLNQREDDWLTVMGRLKPGVTYDQARAAVEVLSRQIQQEYPETSKNASLLAVPEPSARPRVGVGQMVPQMAGVFMALVALVLLIACANIANLMMVRASAREKEMAIRAALGARRFRLVRQVLTESLILAAMGGAAGLVLAYWTTDWLSKIRLSTDAPVYFKLTPDLRVFVFTLLAVLVTGLIAGIAPALQSSKINLNETLKEGGRASSGGSRQRLRSLLVVSQVAVSLLLLICAGLFFRSARNAEQMDMGFRKENLLMMSMDVGLQGYDENRAKQFQRQLIERVKALPGVNSASLSKITPLGYNNSVVDVYVEGRARTREDEKESAFSSVVGLDYFQTLGIPLLSGRDFTQQDDLSSPRAAIVNETLARRFWPGQEPLGKRFQLTRDGPFLEVIGVARDGKYVFLGEDPRAFLYLPLEQNFREDMTLFVHTASDPASFAGAVRQVVRNLDAELPVYDVKSMTSHLRDGLALLFVRLGAMLVGAFGLIGLVLATVGIYGVIAYSVNQRRHEIGIRMALGARQGDVLRMVVGHGLLLAVIGVAIGLAGAFAVTRFTTALLYGVSPTDSLVFTAIPLMLTAIAMAASYIPARRAARVDPMVALRYE